MSIIIPPDPTTINAWITVFTPIVLALSTILTGLVAKWVSDQGKISNEKLDKIHGIVNSSHSAALGVGATALERVAAITKDPKDVELAKAARALSNDNLLGILQLGLKGN
jgi:hypothetical protein